MGVLACDKSGCDHVMCDILFSSEGMSYYLCWECYEQLEHVMLATPEASEDVVTAIVTNFIGQEKDTRDEPERNCLELFQKMCTRRS